MYSRPIRPARPDDAAAIARIHRLARLTVMPWLPDLHTPEEDLEYFATQVLPQQTVLVIDVDGSVVGFIAFHSGWVNHLYIDPGHWERGHGSALLDHAKAGAAHLQLWAFQGNERARRFYVRHGFREIEFTDGAGNQENTPDVRLEWSA